MRALTHRLIQLHFGTLKTSRFHTSTQAIAFLSTQYIDESAPYSPDLAPNDFFLFPYVKNKIRGQCFSTPEEAVDAFGRDESFKLL